jgi:sporulation protein YlmC with PRC-barrel domain
MKGTSILAKACAAALLCTGAAWAQSPSGLIDSSKLDDKKVTDFQGKELGEIDRLLVDPQTGQVRFAVVEVEAPSQQTETEVAVPWQALKIQREGEKDFKIQIDATKDKLEKAPRFSEAETERLFTPEGAKPVFSYWAIIWTEPATGQPPSGTTTTPPGTPGQQSQPSQSGTVGTPDSSQPSTSTPSGQSGSSSSPGSYYQENRQRMAPSSSEQNNYPAGQQPSTSTPSTQPSPSTTVPAPGTSSPSDPSKDKPDISSGAPSTPSTPSEPSTIP